MNNSTFVLIFLFLIMIMITTLIINLHTLQSPYIHVVTIPCTTSTLRYQRPSPREPCYFPTLYPLLYSTFDFSFIPSPLTFLRHFSFLLMTSFSATFFFVFISESSVHEGLFFPVSVSTDADLLYALPVSNVSCCITSHSSTLYKIVFAFFVVMWVTLSDCAVFGVVPVPCACDET